VSFLSRDMYVALTLLHHATKKVKKTMQALLKKYANFIFERLHPVHKQR